MLETKIDMNSAMLIGQSTRVMMNSGLIAEQDQQIDGNNSMINMNKLNLGIVSEKVEETAPVT